jgi:DNA-binding transcriptional LysR family regulator
VDSLARSQIERAEFAKLPHVFFKPPKRRRGKTDHHLMRAGAGAARAPDQKTDVYWSNAMRSFLALGLLITLCASASAATMHHSRHVIVRPAQGHAVLGSAYAAVQPPIHYDDNPSYDDPSKFGGDAALPVH